VIFELIPDQVESAVHLFGQIGYFPNTVAGAGKALEIRRNFMNSVRALSGFYNGIQQVIFKAMYSLVVAALS
jgi:uncharacterized membrane protein